MKIEESLNLFFSQEIHYPLTMRYIAQYCNSRIKIHNCYKSVNVPFLFKILDDAKNVLILMHGVFSLILEIKI